MCLSAVYKKENGENIFLFRNIAKVESENERLIFTDLMGIRRELAGEILDIDLIENIITVKENQI